MSTPSLTFVFYCFQHMKKRKKTGLSPGTLIYEGPERLEDPILLSVEYSDIFYKEHFNEILSPDFKNTKHYLWLDIRGIHNVELIQEIGEKYSLHKLFLEDILDPSVRGSVDFYDNGISMILKYTDIDKTIDRHYTEQIGIFLGESFLITFQENADDTFRTLRTRMKAEQSKTRSRKPDYLFYAIIDYVADQYFLVMDHTEDKLKDLEERASKLSFEKIQEDLYHMRSRISAIRRIILPLREGINQLLKSESAFFHKENLLYFRDLESHLIQIADTLDNQRDLVNSIHEMAMTRVNLRLNQDMRWLAVVSTISIPILFLTGVYGMNFDYMPELKWKYGYLLWWVTIIVVIISMITFFKKRKLF